MMHRIQCTVQVLTRNTIDGLRVCLDSLAAFHEVIVQDGYSTDGTRELADHYPNVRLMDQNRAYLNDECRIINFAAIRNEAIEAAAHDWIFVVDGDEFVQPSLIDEVREIVERDIPGVYQIFRRFSIDGIPVMHCAGYPALQIRLFHRSLTSGYVKAIHERLQLHAGIVPIIMHTELPVPLPPLAELQPKYDRYLAMEIHRQKQVAWSQWIRWILLRNIRSIIGLSFKLLWIWIIPRRGKRMPLSYEISYIRHSIRTIVYTCPFLIRSAPSITP